MPGVRPIKSGGEGWYNHRGKGAKKTHTHEGELLFARQTGTVRIQFQAGWGT